MADHPRTRGVYNGDDHFSVLTDGSSPHTRGLHVGVRVELPQVRIIPAHAGFTLRQRRAGGHRRIIPAHAGFTPRRTRRPGPRPDHPRTRGVYCSIRSPDIRHAGSSPHTRGLLPDEHVARGHVRIIPAHAGFTVQSVRPTYDMLDHPRTRGVYECLPEDQRPPLGSSPHTRGLRHRAQDLRQ